jgi:rubrerythrin
MATTVGTEDNLMDLLQDLRKLDLAASDAYEDAIHHIDDADAKAQLANFKADHVRHTEDLGRLLQEMGQAPQDLPQSGGLKSLLTQGKVMVAGLMGDRQILQAMATNENDTNVAYERATQHPGLSGDVRAVLERNLSDERRHKQWIDARIQLLARAA